MPKAKAAARKALEIDDTLAEAYSSQALVLHSYDRDWSGAERKRPSLSLDSRASRAGEITPFPKPLTI